MTNEVNIAARTYNIVHVKVDAKTLEKYAILHLEYLTLQSKSTKKAQDLARINDLAAAGGSLNEYLKATLPLLSEGEKKSLIDIQMPGVQISSLRENILDAYITTHQDAIIAAPVDENLKQKVLDDAASKLKYWGIFTRKAGYYIEGDDTCYSSPQEYLTKHHQQILNNYIKQNTSQIIQKYKEENSERIISEYIASINSINEDSIVIAEIENFSFGNGSEYDVLDLRGADLSGAKLLRVEFLSANLQGVSFRDTDVRQVIFDDCNLRKADFRGADLDKTQICYSGTVGERNKVFELTAGMQVSYSDHRGYANYTYDINRNDGQGNGPKFGAHFMFNGDHVRLDFKEKFNYDPMYVRGSGNSSSKSSFTVTSDDLQRFVESKKSNLTYSFSDFVAEQNKEFDPEISYLSFAEETDFKTAGLSLTNLNLRGTDFAYCNLSEIDFTGSNLENCCFEGVTAERAKFNDASLINVNAAIANFAGSEFINATMDRANFEGAIFSKIDKKDPTKNLIANLSKAHLNHAILRRAKLNSVAMPSVSANYANMDGIHAIYANMIKIQLRGASLRDAVLDCAKLNDAVLTNAVLDLASLVEADLTDATIQEVSGIGADLRRACLDNVDGKRANLTEACMENVTARKADFEQAILVRIKAKQADMTNALLTQAKALQADFEQAILANILAEEIDLRYGLLKQAKAINANFTAARLDALDAHFTDLSSSVLTSAFVRYASMSDAILMEAKLKNADIAEANFRNANLKKADATGAKISENTNFIGADLTGAIGADAIRELQARQKLRETFLGRAKEYTTKLAMSTWRIISNSSTMLLSIVLGCAVGCSFGAVAILAFTKMTAPLSLFALTAVITGCSIGFAAKSCYDFFKEQDAKALSKDKASDNSYIRKDIVLGYTKAFFRGLVNGLIIGAAIGFSPYALAEIPTGVLNISIGLSSITLGAYEGIQVSKKSVSRALTSFKNSALGNYEETLERPPIRVVKALEITRKDPKSVDVAKKEAKKALSAIYKPNNFVSRILGDISNLSSRFRG